MQPGSWEGVIGQYWARLRSVPGGLAAESAQPVSHWSWLTDYLQTEVDFETVLASFPIDEPMRASVGECRGLRLLRQDPWECLASFILSSTKQIVQIQQIVALLCERFGPEVIVPAGNEAVYGFPTAERLALAGEHELRACKMGFRAPNLLRTAQMIAGGEVDLEKIRSLALEQAREELLRLPGVGHKIANCILLFAYGFQGAFPIDVWVMKALRQLYFPKRRPTAQRIHRFTTEYFGPNAGYAQQYLFHYMRTRKTAANPSLKAARKLEITEKMSGERSNGEGPEDVIKSAGQFKGVRAPALIRAAKRRERRGPEISEAE